MDADHSDVVDHVFEAKRDGEGGDRSPQTDNFHHDQAHWNRHSRWWFASAAFPMIAGTLGPVASAFSICALVKPWRQQILPRGDITNAIFIHDPPWLLAANAVQLVIAITSNLFLLLNMTKRIRFSVAQPVTFAGWYLSSIMLIVLCTTASGLLLLQHENEYVWSQAFYYGIFAAVIYFIVASLMVVTFWGARAGHFSRDFELTMSQRTLMLQTILFLMYLLLGALAFSHIEGWLYLDAVYWADITLFTVGFGDLPLKTNLGRGLMIPYSLIGVTTLGLVIGSIRSLMLDRGKVKLDARVLEKKRRRFVRRLNRSGKGTALEPIRKKDAPDMELARRQNEYHMMRKIQDQASRERRWMAMGVSTSCWLVLWLVGAKIFQVCEDPYQSWSYFDGVYFSFQAMVTIGYGDITPLSNAAKAFFVFWSLLALPTLTVLISNAGDTVVKEIRDLTVFLGNITILPGEHGYSVDIKQYLSKLSFGVLFSEVQIRQSPPGFLGVTEPHSASDGDKEDDENPTDDELSAPNGQCNDEEKGEPGPRVPSPGQQNGAKQKNPILSRIRSLRHRITQPEKRREHSFDGQDIPNKLPKSRDEYLIVLISEIRKVSQHLQHEPQRQYTYQEWAYYLHLIGEDEGDPSTHRNPYKNLYLMNNKEVRQPARAHSNNGGGRQQHGSRHWWWIGQHSPLMDPRDEAGWILDKLTQRLQKELAEAAKSAEVMTGPEVLERFNRGRMARAAESSGSQGHVGVYKASPRAGGLSAVPPRLDAQVWTGAAAPATTHISAVTKNPKRIYKLQSNHYFHDINLLAPSQPQRKWPTQSPSVLASSSGIPCLLADIIHPDQAGISKANLQEKLASLYKATPEQVSVFGLRTAFGGGKTTAFACIYDSVEARKKFDAKHRLVRAGLATKPERASRQQRKQRKNRMKTLRGTEKTKGKKAKKDS
ncbi:hypothetical protein RRF57_001990 [Xylaria bambusicola]|uniref:Potassium channel domain-containing protein n=1 Tax=Xylaria bambusicola TaxID=326684 RepID=A0AAN7U6A3_9PEZI